MLDRREVLAQLGIAPSSGPTTAAALSHATAAANALELLAGREVTSTPDLIAYAQAEATLSIALTLADIRTHLEKP